MCFVENRTSKKKSGASKKRSLFYKVTLNSLFRPEAFIKKKSHETLSSHIVHTLSQGLDISALVQPCCTNRFLWRRGRVSDFDPGDPGSIPGRVRYEEFFFACYIYCRPCGVVAQWSECSHGMREVLGVPVGPCAFPPLWHLVAQCGSVLGLRAAKRLSRRFRHGSEQIRGRI